MRITTGQLKRIIAEEVTRVLAEAAGDDVELVGSFKQTRDFDYQFTVKYQGKTVPMTATANDVGALDTAEACIYQTLYDLGLIGQEEYPSGVDDVAGALVAYAADLRRYWGMDA